MPLKRLSEKTELGKIRRGYIINVRSTKAYLHASNCITIPMMNPERSEKGGIYYSENLEGAIQWIKNEGLRHTACRLCLHALTHRPRPSKLVF